MSGPTYVTESLAERQGIRGGTGGDRPAKDTFRRGAALPDRHFGRRSGPRPPRPRCVTREPGHLQVWAPEAPSEPALGLETLGLAQLRIRYDFDR